VSGAQMVDYKLLKELKHGVEAWNNWRKDFPDISLDFKAADLRAAKLKRVELISANLSEARLMGAYLEGANLNYANLSKADLRMSYLRGAKLKEADLSDAKLNESNLRGVNLRRANLSRVFLSHADLSKADLSGANLTGANLQAANLSDADLEEVDLRGADLIGSNLKRANLLGTNLSRAVVDEKTLKTITNNKGVQIGVNGIWSEITDTAALMTLTPQGNSMEGPNPESVIESLKRARRLHGFSLSLVGIVLLIATLSLSKIPFPYAEGVRVAPEQFCKLAMPMSIALIFLSNIYLSDALKGARYLNDRRSAMSVGKFPWVLSKFSSREHPSGFLGWIKLAIMQSQSTIPRFAMSFHGIIYIYYVELWGASTNIKYFYLLSAIIMLVSMWTFVISDRFQKPILFDWQTEKELKDDLAEIADSIKLQTHTISKFVNSLRKGNCEETININEEIKKVMI
jgi:uncharacterized protein YjbI with pentapeptide repeats